MKALPIKSSDQIAVEDCEAIVLVKRGDWQIRAHSSEFWEAFERPMLHFLCTAEVISDQI